MVLHGKLGDWETGIEGEHPAFGLAVATDVALEAVVAVVDG